MSYLYNPLALSIVTGLAVFICVYRFSDQILNFFSTKVLTAQKEILDIMDKLLMTQKKEIIIRNCWILSLSLSGLVVLMFWPNVLLSLGVGGAMLLLTWLGIRLILRSLWESHCDKVVAQLVEALTIMCNSLKVGLGLTQSMDRVIKGYPGPLAKEFRLVLNKIQLGQSVEEALTEMGERINRPDIDMLVTAINILKETGGNLAETFYVMADTLRERQKMDKKIKALTAQGKMQAKIISSIPFLLIGIFYVMDREYISPLLFKPLGWVCLGGVVLLVALGAIMMKKMIEIKV
ncbi:MAG: type II secretion system F family protein [Bdellovibrionales bacterium]|nr:type II secretion system F family protein [Bdellovibrionales bacterium]